jgi:hypothetical protein
MKRIYVAFLGVVLALFALDSINSLVTPGDFGGIANAQSAADSSDGWPAADADVTSQPDASPNIAGTWSGPITTTGFGDGTLDLTIVQKTNAAALKGTWSAMLPDGTFTGKLKGSENNSAGMIDLKNKRRHHGTCILHTAVTLPDDTHMNGTLTTTGGCNPSSTGSFALVKQ